MSTERKLCGLAVTAPALGRVVECTLVRGHTTTHFNHAEKVEWGAPPLPTSPEHGGANFETIDDGFLVFNTTEKSDMNKADPNLIAELLGKPIPKPGDNFASNDQIEALIAHAKAQGRDVTDAEFFSALGLGPNPSPEDRKRACAAIRAIGEERDRALEGIRKINTTLGLPPDASVEQSIAKWRAMQATERQLIDTVMKGGKSS